MDRSFDGPHIDGVPGQAKIGVQQVAMAIFLGRPPRNHFNQGSSSALGASLDDPFEGGRNSSEGPSSVIMLPTRMTSRSSRDHAGAAVPEPSELFAL